MRWARAHRKLVLALGVCVLVAVGAGAGFTVARGGGGSSALPTTGQYAPIHVSRQKVTSIGGGLARDLDAGVQTYLSTQLQQLPGQRRYSVRILNTSNLGFIDAIQWYPPVGVRIVRVTGTSAGRCELTGLTGIGGNQFATVVLYPNVECRQVNLKPPTCTCLGDGGSFSISFVADRNMPSSGVARAMSARLVVKPIPSFLKTKASPQDLSTMQG